MRATAGSVSARFQALRLPLGAGLGGLVAQTRRPYWTRRLPRRRALRAHQRRSTPPSTTRGWSAICGTPLLVRRAFVGVLFASNRTARPFPHDEVALLGSLADAGRGVARADPRAPPRPARRWRRCRRPVHGARQAASSRPPRRTTASRRSCSPAAGSTTSRPRSASCWACWVVVLDAERARGGRSTAAPTTGRIVARAPGGAGRARLRAARRGRRHVGGRRYTRRASGWARSCWAAAATWTPATGAPWSARPWSPALVLLFRRQSAQEDRRVRADLLVDLLAHTGGRGGTQAEALVARGLAARGRSDHGRRRPRRRTRVDRPAPRPGAGGRAATGADDGAATLVAEHAGDVVVLTAARDASAAARRLADRLGRHCSRRRGRRAASAAHRAARRAHRGSTDRGGAGGPRQRPPRRLGRRPRLRRSRRRRAPGRRRLRPLGARPAARLRRAPRHGPRRHGGGVVRRGHQPHRRLQRGCTCTRTPCRSAWTASAGCSARTGRTPSVPWRCSSHCGCCVSAPDAPLPATTPARRWPRSPVSGLPPE